MENRRALRLQVFMASCGVGSRRTCERLIDEGRVAINGRTVERQGEKIDPSTDTVTLDGTHLVENSQKVYLALNKPPGYICTSQDPEGRPLALELFGSLARSNRLFSVGRLDLLSSGLIFYTNDGAFAGAVAHPSSGIEKEYLIETRRPVPEETLDRFVEGISYNGVSYAIVRYIRKTPTKILIVLQEGKNRELRNMFAAARVQIKRIHRVRIGPIHIGALPPGQFRFLSRREVASLTAAPSRPPVSGAAAQRRPPRTSGAHGTSLAKRSPRPAGPARGTGPASSKRPPKGGR